MDSFFEPHTNYIDNCFDAMACKMQYRCLVARYNWILMHAERAYSTLINNELYFWFYEKNPALQSFTICHNTVCQSDLANFVNKEIWINFLNAKCKVLGNVQSGKDKNALKFAASQPASLQIEEKVNQKVGWVWDSCSLEKSNEHPECTQF